ncbi:MAG: HAMP domain-containing sensor histidine kinase [Tissierellia bacterium]|nr:HAMP domain-containing sensor histidine kinase [Tissierellia bacterium]
MFLLKGKNYLRIVLLNIVLIIVMTFLVSYEIDNRVLKNRKEIEKNLLRKVITTKSLEGLENDIEKALNDHDLEELLAKTEQLNAGKVKKSILRVKVLKTFTLVFTVVIFIYILNYIFIRLAQKKYIKSIDKYIDSLQGYKFDYALPEKDGSIISKLNNRFNKLGISIKRNHYGIEQENERIKTILADISHQIKTPLAALSMYNEILIDSQIDENQSEFLDLSQKQISRLKWLIESLLKISRLDSNMIKMNKDEFIISELSYNFDKVFINKLKDSNLKILIRGSVDEKVNLDYDWTREALLNLVKNATEHAKPNSEIIIDYYVNIQMIKIDVINEGKNISSEELTKVFSRFYKTKDNKNPESVGIGLNLSKKIVELQGGTISIENIEGGVKFSLIFLK